MSAYRCKRQLTREEAIALHDSNAWEVMTDRQIVLLQLFQECLCVPFGRFHQAIEAELGRPVWTHEFARWDEIAKEFLGEREAPTFAEILDIIPVEKRLLLRFE
jgi:hypothetical protein